MSRRWRTTSLPYLETGADGPLLEAWVDAVPRAETPIIDFLVALNRRVLGDISYSIRLDSGVQTPDETLELGRRVVPRQRLAAGDSAAQARDRRALRVRLPRPAGRGRSARGQRCAAVRLHRPARLGRGVRPRRRVDRPGPHLGTAGRRRAHPARVHRAADRPPRRSPELVDAAQTTFEYSNVVRRIHEPPRTTLPYTAHSGSGSTLSGAPSTLTCRRMTSG